LFQCFLKEYSIERKNIFLSRESYLKERDRMITLPKIKEEKSTPKIVNEKKRVVNGDAP